MNPGNLLLHRSHTGRDFLTERIDQPFPNVWYYGAASSHLKTTADPVWEIKRVYILPSGETEITYASGGGFVHIWDNRTGYFNAAIPGPNPNADISLTSPIDGGKITIVTLNNTAWTPIPAISILNRQGIGIQNLSGDFIKLNWNNLAPPSEGIIITDGGERYYSAKTTATIYGRFANLATGTVTVEELHS